MTTAHAGWWQLERPVQRPASNASDGPGAAPEVLWSNRPLPRQARLLAPEAVGCP